MSPTFVFAKCSLEFESWSLDSSTMAFREEASVIVDDNFLSTHWTLCDKNSTVYNVVYEFSGETFSRVKFDFTVRRKSTFYLINLIFPCATLSAIELLVFAIPSQDCSSDRIGFGTTNLLTLVVFQTIVTEEMPKTSDAVTSLSKYIISLIILSAIGIFESVFIERIRRIRIRPPPVLLLRLTRSITSLLCSKSMYECYIVRPSDADCIAEEDVPTARPSNYTAVITPSPTNPFQQNGTCCLSTQNKNNGCVLDTMPFKPVLSGDEEEIPFIEQGVSSSSSMAFAPPVGNLLPIPLPLNQNNAKRNSSNSKNENQPLIATANHLKVNGVLSSQSTGTQLRYRKLSHCESSGVFSNRQRREALEARYCELWCEIATQLDLMTLIVSTMSAIIFPLSLFLPLLSFSDDC